MTNYYDTSYPPSLWAAPDPVPDPESPPPDEPDETGPDEPEPTVEPEPEPECEPEPALVIDPAHHTIDEITTFVTESYDVDLVPGDPDAVAELRAVRDAEIDGRNRVTLIGWLDETIGESE